MNLVELATAVSNRLPVVVVIFNNNVLGMVRQWQTQFYAKRYSETTLDRKTDYVRLAQSFGATGFRATTQAELDQALQAAFACEGPCVIDAVIDKDEKVLPMIPAGKSIDEIIM